VAAAIEVVTPTLYAEDVATQTLKPGAKNALELALSRDQHFTMNGEMLTVDSQGNAVFSGTVQAKSIAAESITGLNIFAEKLAVLTDTVAHLEDRPEEVTEADLSALQSLIMEFNLSSEDLRSNLVATQDELRAELEALASVQLATTDTLGANLAAVADRLAVLETLISERALAITDAEARLTALEQPQSLDIAALDLSGHLSIAGLTTFAGGARVDTIGSLADQTALLNDAVLIGRPYFNQDTAGFAVIKAGSREVEVVFDEPYPEQPVVEVSLSFEGDEHEAFFEAQAPSFIVTRKTVQGFTILLNEPPTHDLHFTWMALAIQGAETALSLNQSE
jgi:hypothetical protein